MHTTKVQFGEPVAYRSMGEGSLTGADMTHRQLHHQGWLQYGWQVRKAENLEHTAQPTGSTIGRKCLFLVPQLVQTSSGSSTGLSLHCSFSSVFVVGGFGLVWFCAVQAVSSERVSVFIGYSGREWPSESGQFQGLPEAILSCLS